MAVQTIDYTLKVPKELKEIIDAETALVKHFINGGDINGAMALLPGVMVAADGYQHVAEEIKSQFKDEAAAYLVHKQWESLEKDPVSVDPGAPELPA
jgi:hypothetical protein